MISDPWFYAVAVPAVVVVGLSKGGIGGGLSLLGVPLMALVIAPIQAAAIMLPILVVMDVVALIAWRGVFDRDSVRILLPSTIAGLGIAWLLAAYVTEGEVRLAVGLLTLLFLAQQAWLRVRGAGGAPKQHSVAKGWLAGIAGGIASFISHSGGPPLQMYLLPLRLDPRVMAGTTVLVFAVANFLKVIPYLMLGQFSPANVATSLVLLPLAPVSTYYGARLVRGMASGLFYQITYALLLVVGVKLTWDGWASLGSVQ